MNPHANPISAPPIAGAYTCKNCGHERKDHDYDDGCWREIEASGRIILCVCPGFLPIAPVEPSAEDTPLWRKLLHETLLERNPDKLTEKIADAERAIRQRIGQVKPSDGREWQQLRDALQTLDFVRML
jgi:hypothetical protein